MYSRKQLIEHEFINCGGKTAIIVLVVVEGVVPWFEKCQVVLGVSLLEGPSCNVMETKQLRSVPFIIGPVLVHIMIQAEMRQI